MFQSLKRDNCLSNMPRGLWEVRHRVFQSLKRDNCLSNSPVSFVLSSITA